jgi:putative transcriptional regulator
MTDRAQQITDKIAASFNELADTLASGKKVTGAFNCRKIVLDLRPMPYPPELVKETRRILRCSQGVFAQFLGMKVSAIRKWEQGRQAPSNMACRFMDEIRLCPDHCKKRLRESVKIKQNI